MMIPKKKDPMIEEIDPNGQTESKINTRVELQ